MGDANEHYKQGLALYGRQDLEGAIAEFQAALEARPDWEDALHGLAMAQMKAGKLDEALASTQRLVELAPEDPSYRTTLSMVYVRKGLIDEAEKAQAESRMLAWKQELEKNPNAPPPADAGGMNVVQ